MDENIILDYFESPQHRGVLELATHQQYVRNPACGDEVTLQLQIDVERIATARFKAAGCMISQAAASMLCEYVEQKRLADLAEFQADDMLNLIGVPLTPRRQQCGLLPFKALKTIVYASAKT